MKLDYIGHTIADGLALIKEDCQNYVVTTSTKKIDYYNIPASFDIETSSFYKDGEKQATMYVWQFCINGIVVIGRKWSEFIDFVENLVDMLSISIKKRLIVYVHSLAFEFQWFRKFFCWNKVFALSDRKPVYAVTDSGIEFRCSYILTGVSLEHLGNYLHKYSVTKAVGDLDYTKIRHSQTPLSEEELGYCVRDVLVVVAYIQECIDK